MALILPKGHKDGVPSLMDNNLLRHDGLGASLLLQQVVLSHKHPVRELRAGETEQTTTNQTEDLVLSQTF